MVILTGWFKLVGISLVNLKLLSAVVAITTDLLIYVAAKKRVLPVVLYVLLYFIFEGNGLWPDQLLAPLFLAVYLAIKAKQWILTGFFLGLALLTKQTAGYFAVVVVVTALLHTGNRGRIFAGLAAVWLVTLGILWQTGTLWDFYNQTLVYIFSYHVANNLQEQWPTKGQIILLIAIFLVPIVSATWQRKYFLAAVAAVSMLGIFTRFEYFHLQPALPFLALILAETWLIWPLILILFGRIVMMTIGSEPRFMIRQILNQAKIINQYVTPGSKTLIMTSTDHLYWLTGTLPAGNFFGSSIPWNFNYPGVQERVVSGLISDRPKYVFLSSCFEAKYTCYQPIVIEEFVKNNYVLKLKLADGTRVFENNPVSLSQEL